MSARLWERSLDLARAALDSDYIQGIRKGTLDPEAYGQYSVQDVAYCHRGLDDWRRVATRASHASVRSFAEARVKSWQSYVEETYAAWHITDPAAVRLCDAAQAYADFESEVATSYEPIYAVVVMTPCDRLWSWLARQLRADATASNLYRFWIEENRDDSGAVHLEQAIDANAELLDEDTASKVFRRAMRGELDFFRAACGQPSWISPDPPSPS
ncbi:MAG: TenA family transcriptional regulator [Acidobacteriota bacterium]